MAQDPEPTLGALLAEAQTALEGSPSPRADAEALVLACCGVDRSALYSHPERPVPTDQAERLRAGLKRRADGEPVAYIVGHRAFWKQELMVDPSVLIPRPETELLIERALALFAGRAPERIADLGTGSGALAIALASEFPQAEVVAVDVDEVALGLARRNAEQAGVGGRIDLRRGDWETPLGDQRFELMVSNPPYVPAYDPHLQQGDVRFEPHHALAAGADGLSDIRHIIEAAHDHLEPGAWLLLEHGHDQGPQVRRLMAAAGFEDVATHQDLADLDRMVEGRWPSEPDPAWS